MITIYTTGKIFPGNSYTGILMYFRHNNIFMFFKKTNKIVMPFDMLQDKFNKVLLFCKNIHIFNLFL